MKKILCVFTLFALILTGCSLADEMMASSIYTDFMADFTKQWETLSKTVKPIYNEKENAYIYHFDLKPGVVKGLIGYTYSGTVDIVFDARKVNPNDTEFKSFYVVKADLKAVSPLKEGVAAKPHVDTDSMYFELGCMGDAGFILDGWVKTSLTTPEFGTTTQVANMEGLYFPLKRDLTVAPLIGGPNKSAPTPEAKPEVKPGTDPVKPEPPAVDPKPGTNPIPGTEGEGTGTEPVTPEPGEGTDPGKTDPPVEGTTPEPPVEVPTP